MKINGLGSGSAAIFVRDIEISKKFYAGVLGMQIKVDFGKNVTFDGFSIWEVRQDHIIPEKLGSEKIFGKRSNKFELYFETEDIDNIISLLANNNVKLLHNIHEERWGQRTVRFFDPDDHLIEIGESMKKFIGRFHDMGFSPDEIFLKTSVPVEEVRRLLGLK